MELFRLGFLVVTLLDLIDILLVAVLLYQLYRLVKGSAAMNILAGIIPVYVFWLLVKALKMQLLGSILGQVIGVGMLALIIVFQQEIRKFLILIGTNSILAKNNFPKNFLFRNSASAKERQLDTDSVVKACRQMAKTRTGAILVLARNTELTLFTSTGDTLDAEISRRLIENIFFKGSPLHDGAIVIVQNRIKAAHCVLPISENPDLPARLGMRHRAALGMTEQSDSVVITVSEETGEIALAKEGEIFVNLSAEDLEKRLNEDFN